MKKRINISLDTETVESLKKLADMSHKSVSQWISDSVWKAIAENESEVGKEGENK